MARGPVRETTSQLARPGEGRAYIRVSDKVAKLIEDDSALAEWSDEELARGQALSKAGDFSGRPPTMVPRVVYQEWARRQMEAGFSDMVGDLRGIVRVVREIATDPGNDVSVRLRACEMVLDRVYGKPRQAVSVGLEQPERHAALIEAVTINRELDAGDDEAIVDAEIVSEGDSDDDWDEWDRRGDESG